MAIQLERPRSKSSPPPRIQNIRQPLFARHQLPGQTTPVRWPGTSDPKSCFPIQPTTVMLPLFDHQAVDLDPGRPINPPSWHPEFRPRLPSADGSKSWESPIPRCENIGHAILLREAMTKFHLAVYLADEDAGESSIRLRQNLALVCEQYMPAMAKLGVRKHQIVFFYHGRGYQEIGNEVWESVTDWEQEQYRLRQTKEKRIWQEWQDYAKHHETMARTGRDGHAWGPMRTE